MRISSSSIVHYSLAASVGVLSGLASGQETTTYATTTTEATTTEATTADTYFDTVGPTTEWAVPPATATYSDNFISIDRVSESFSTWYQFANEYSLMINDIEQGDVQLGENAPDVDLTVKFLRALLAVTESKGGLNAIPQVMWWPFKKWWNVQYAGSRPTLRNGAGACTGACNIPIDLTGLWGYGCHCNFHNNILLGHGDPVNLHDNLCMDYKNCMKCISIDQELDENNTLGWANSTCDPTQANFKLGFMSFGSTQASIINADCASNNAEPCETFSCACTMKFIGGLIQAIFDPNNQYDPAYKHAGQGGTWDPNTGCAINQGNPGSATYNDPDPALNCCGGYPERVPFKAHGVKECCSGTQTLYHQLNQQCCTSEVIPISEVCP